MLLTGLTPNPISTAILRTLTYYDTHDFPLTAKEIWRWVDVKGLQIQDFSIGAVQTAVDQLAQSGQIERHGEWFILPGRSELIELRRQRLKAGEKKWRRAITTAKYLQIVPFVKMVAVVNTLAIDNARPESDIDLLIVTAPQHIWLSRTMVTGIVSMLGYRRHGNKITNRVCLSFFVTTDALDLEPLKSEPDDVHFTYWAAQAVPLLDDGTYQKFVSANGWVAKKLPNAWSWDWKAKLVAPQSGLIAIKHMYQATFSTPIGAWLEHWARTRQLKKMEKNTDSKSKEPTTDVIISDDVLKFHEADRRKEYNQKFQDRLKTLGLE